MTAPAGIGDLGDSPATAYAADHGIGLRVEGPDELYPGAYRVTEAAAQAIGAATAAVAAFDRVRTGRAQVVAIDRTHAAVAFRSEWHVRIDGQPPPSPFGPIAGYYATADGGWLQIHSIFAHHQDRALGVLGLHEADRGSVTAAVGSRDAQELEDAMAAAGAVASRQRTTEDWLGHAQGRALGALPTLDLERLGDAPTEVPEPVDARPLSGVRILDLTRVIAGPLAGRFLAAHGAHVLKVDGSHLAQVDGLVVDTGAGKRTCFLDLRDEGDRARFLDLVDDADIVVDGYRPGALGALGLSAESLVARRPGLVVVHLSAYGPDGPWAARRGFDSLVQTATGVTATGQRLAGTARPTPLPCQALDHATGYLAAFGAVEALRRRSTEGGSWRVRVSLARTRHWLERLGVVDLTALPEPEVPADLLHDLESPLGRVTLVRPPGELSVTPPHWATGPVPLGTHPPTWA